MEITVVPLLVNTSPFHSHSAALQRQCQTIPFPLSSSETGLDHIDTLQKPTAPSLGLRCSSSSQDSRIIPSKPPEGVPPTREKDQRPKKCKGKSDVPISVFLKCLSLCLYSVRLLLTHQRPMCHLHWPLQTEAITLCPAQLSTACDVSLQNTGCGLLPISVAASQEDS